MRVTENLGWKLLSLFIAGLLWHLLVGETEVATSMPIVVQYRNIPEDLEVTGDHLDRLFVKVRGPLPRVSAEALSHLPLILDLGFVRAPGEQTFNVTEQELGLPAGVRLVRAVPGQIRISLQRRITRKVPVEVRFTGSVPAGFRIASQQVDPAEAQITGPEFHVARTRTVFTDPVSLNPTPGKLQFQVPLYVNDPQVRVENHRLAVVSINLEKVPQTN
jgi:hypothetical protein